MSAELPRLSDSSAASFFLADLGFGVGASGVSTAGAVRVPVIARVKGYAAAFAFAGQSPRRCSLPKPAGGLIAPLPLVILAKRPSLTEGQLLRFGWSQERTNALFTFPR